MRKLAVQSSNDTLTDEDRLQIQSEIQQIKDEIDEIVQTTTFNGLKLLDGTYCGVDNILSDARNSAVTGNKYIGVSGLIVETGKNDSFEFVIGGTTKNITLASGTYSTIQAGGTSDFDQALNDAFDAAGLNVKTYIVGVVGSETAPKRVIEFDIYGNEGTHTFGNVGGNARSILMDRIEYPAWNWIDSSNTVSGSCTGFPSSITGNVDLSSGLTITGGINDTLNIEIDGIWETMTLNPGKYNSTDLLTEINHRFIYYFI